MKTQTFKWGESKWEFYKPKVNRRRQAILGSLILGDIILPLTFGLGIVMAKMITKLNPLFLYK